MGNVKGTSARTPFRLPTSAWAEVRDATGERLRTLGARLEEGRIVVDLPAFAPGTRGTVTLVVDGGREERSLTAGIDELPTRRTQWVVESRVHDANGASPQATPS